MYVHLLFFTDFKKTMPKLGNKAKKMVTNLSMLCWCIDKPNAFAEEPEKALSKTEVQQWNTQWIQKVERKQELR